MIVINSLSKSKIDQNQTITKRSMMFSQAMQKQFVDDIISNKLGPLKPALSHVGLYAGLVIYTAVGAMVSGSYLLF